MDKFNINDFEFRIVEMDVFSKISKSNLQNPDDFKFDNKIKYYLLVDEQNFIHDWKMQFEKIAFKNWTTKSHETKKKDKFELILRKKMFELFGVKHLFVDENVVDKSIDEQKNKKPRPKKPIYCFDEIEIKKSKFNKFLWEDPYFSEMTFQYVEYVLFGSNSSGQPTGGHGLLTKFNDHETVFGIFLSTLNINKKIRSKAYAGNNFNNIYESVWEQIESKGKHITFDKYVNGCETLKNFFMSLSSEQSRRKHNDKNWWKKEKMKFKYQMHEEFAKWENLSSKISQLRNLQKKQYQDWFKQKWNCQIKTNESFFNIQTFNYFFNLDEQKTPTKFTYAHIYPVKKIKQEYLNEGNVNKKNNILNEISCIDNFLPLPSDIHEYYDLKFFHWDNNGIIEFNEQKTLSNNDLKEINNYHKINKQALSTQRLKYLLKYKKMLKTIECNDKKNRK